MQAGTQRDVLQPGGSPKPGFSARSASPGVVCKLLRNSTLLRNPSPCTKPSPTANNKPSEAGRPLTQGSKVAPDGISLENEATERHAARRHAGFPSRGTTPCCLLPQALLTGTPQTFLSSESDGECRKLLVSCAHTGEENSKLKLLKLNWKLKPSEPPARSNPRDG